MFSEAIPYEDIDVSKITFSKFNKDKIPNVWMSYPTYQGKSLVFMTPKIPSYRITTTNYRINLKIYNEFDKFLITFGEHVESELKKSVENYDSWNYQSPIRVTGHGCVHTCGLKYNLHYKNFKEKMEIFVKEKNKIKSVEYDTVDDIRDKINGSYTVQFIVHVTNLHVLNKTNGKQQYGVTLKALQMLIEKPLLLHERFSDYAFIDQEDENNEDDEEDDEDDDEENWMNLCI